MHVVTALNKVSSSIRNHGLIHTFHTVLARVADTGRQYWKTQKRAMTSKWLEQRSDATGCIIRTIHGSRMRLHVGPAGAHPLELTLALDGTREPASTEFYASVLRSLRKEWEARPPALILDVGANVGYFALLQAQIFGDRARVIAVEAEQENASRLEYNVRLNAYTNMEVLSVAAGAAPGTGSIARRDASNLHRMAEVSPDRSNLQMVEIVTIDGLISRHAESESSPIIVRMDIEGYEGFAFEGMSELMAAARPCYIFFELHKSAATWFPRIVDALRSGGFEVERLDASKGNGKRLISPSGLHDILELESNAHVFCRR
jgi:FkbM family methyltransferase